MRLGIGTKLLSIFGLSALLTIIVGAVGVAQAGAINGRAGLMYSEDLVGMRLVAELTHDTVIVSNTFFPTNCAPGIPRIIHPYGP